MINLREIFNKNIKLVILGLLAVDLISFWGSQNSLVNQTAFIFILLAFIALSLKNVSWGLLIMLAELFVGSKGYLFYFQFGNLQISIRLALFCSLLAIWLFKYLIKPKAKLDWQVFLIPYLVLLLAIILGFLKGLIGNGLNLTYLDANAWLYFLIAPVFFAEINDYPKIKNILSVLMSCAIYFSLKTIATFIYFAHYLTIDSPVYRWLRNSGVGEITYLTGSFYRIFFQSQIYIVIALIVIIVFWLFNGNLPKNIKSWLWLSTILFSTALLISLSRSFWLGLIAALLICFGAYFYFNRPNLLSILKIALICCVVFALEVFFIQVVSKTVGQNIFSSRLTSSSSDSAGSSRLNQLKPLAQGISKHWLLGSGFGTQITYLSNDPRIRSANPSGVYATYAFEWGYFDLWLKIGLFGLLAYFWLLGKMFWCKDGPVGLILGLKLALIAVLAINVFSPYLNHPLGISFVLLTAAIFNYFNNNGIQSDKISY